ncbi:alpha-amylase family glycosyl hydrolase [Marinoscillum furvescens]|uniref:Alpha-amylase n=1 Tax=Marinoscillum furvescens DSM 4134 TaxID=1122208 RepID=A0A3D9L4X8_MARFU|nr:alpha-amylase family glycosyl hydrolase [Marinoscillum furvescens]RED97980.1 glycosidase [Marinoscillum furvescens DSM 4134]
MWQDRVVYEIFVQSFCDSNGDGIGDLNGVTSKLDYLADLGVGAIWLTPIHPSPSYHKYDVTDYYSIHPDYGTIEDFQRLLKEAHQRDIKIVIDLVINHCSHLHPWFRSALDPESEFRDFFVWASEAEIKAEDNLVKEITGDSDNTHQWNAVQGQDEMYFGFFWSGMPDLNYDNPRVREEIYKVGKYWLTEIGVDGFRLDAAKHIYPDHRAKDNHAFWKEFKSTMESYKRDVYLVGEVWADLPTQAPFAGGFTSLFNFDLSFSIMESVKNERLVGATIHKNAWRLLENQSPISLFLASMEAFTRNNPNFINATFLTNHDQNRVMSFLENEQKGKLAPAILLTFPGIPYIYYGEEIGMRGMKPDEQIREPMLWDDEENDGCRTRWMTPIYNINGTTPSVNQQRSNTSSMYHHYRRLIQIRNQSEALRHGGLASIDLKDDEVLAYVREYGTELAHVYHNLSGQSKSIVKAPGDMVFVTKDSKLEGETVVLPPYESIIFISKPQK